MIRKNSYELGVFNGDIGKVVFITMDNIVVDLEGFSNESNRVEIPMRIADELLKLAYAITVHKCVPDYSPVYTKRGIIPIKEISTNDYVLAKDGEYHKVKWSGPTSKKSRLKIVTSTGLSFEVAPEHNMLVSDDTGIRYMRARHLSIGKYLCSPRKEIPGCDIFIKHTNTNYKNTKTQIKLPEKVTSDFAWMLGALIGDGCYTDKEDGIVDFICPDSPELMNLVEKVVGSCGIRTCGHYKRKKKFSVYFCARNFRDWMLSIGLDYVRADKKVLPDIIFRCPSDIRWDFVSGLIDTDGCIGENKIRYTTSSEKLAKQFQLLLNSLGVVSFFSSQNPKHHKVSVFSIDAKLMRERLNLRCFSKKRALNSMKFSDKDKTNHYVIPFGKSFVDLFKRTFQKNEGFSKGIKGKGLLVKSPYLFRALSGIKTGRNSLRRNVLMSMREMSLKYGFELPKEIQGTIDNDFYYDEIVSIESMPDKVPMWDIEVEGDPSYTVFGYLCHNSQGLEYPLVIMPFIRAHGNFLLQRNLLYTAVTRAKKKVIILGQASALEAAIKNDKIQKRNTRLSERIKEWMQGNGISMRDKFSNSAGCQNAAALDRLLSLEASGG